jgi:hypothetical protein
MTRRKQIQRIKVQDTAAAVRTSKGARKMFLGRDPELSWRNFDEVIFQDLKISLDK